MTVGTALRPLPLDDLAALPETGDRYEIIHGELVVTAAPIPVHEDATVELTLLIGPFVKERRLGKVYTAPIDVQLTVHDVLQPDLCFVSSERRHIVKGKLIDGAPDLIVE